MSKYNEIKAALLGAGTVGGGVYKLIEKRKSEMPSKIQAELTITKVLVKNLNKKREGIPDEVLTDDWQEILDDPEISIVIELMGGFIYGNWVAPVTSIPGNLVQIGVAAVLVLPIAEVVRRAIRR